MAEVWVARIIRLVGNVGDDRRSYVRGLIKTQTVIHFTGEAQFNRFHYLVQVLGTTHTTTLTDSMPWVQKKLDQKSAKFANLLEIKTCLRHSQRAGGALMLNGAYFPNADGTFICAGGASPPMLRRPFPQCRSGRFAKARLMRHTELNSLQLRK